MTDEMMPTSGLNRFLHLQLPGQIVSVGPDVFLKPVKRMVRMGLHNETRLIMQPHPLLKEKKRKERYRFNQPLARNWLFSHLTPFSCLPNAKIITALSRSLR